MIDESQEHLLFDNTISNTVLISKGNLKNHAQKALTLNAMTKHLNVKDNGEYKQGGQLTKEQVNKLQKKKGENVSKEQDMEEVD